MIVWDCFLLKIRISTLASSQPISIEAPSSVIKMRTCFILNDVSEIRVLTIEIIIAKRIITDTSSSTVTPIAVRVKGPFARSSLITAIADAGERATNIVPARSEMPSRVVMSKLLRNGILLLRRKIAMLESKKVIDSKQMVIHRILFIRLLYSFRYNSAPAAKAIKARDISFMNLSLPVASAGISPRICGPVIIPITRSPVTTGRCIFLNNNDNFCDATRIIINPVKRLIISQYSIRGIIQ